jgi:hypothetical protein
MRDFHALAANIHVRNRKWWYTEDGVLLIRDPGELFMLAVSEEAESMEGVRKSLMDDKLPHRLMEEVEQADTVIRLLDSSVGLNIGLDEDIIRQRDQLTRKTKAANLLEIVKKIGRLDDAFLDGDIFIARACLSAAISLCYDYCAEYGLDLDGAIDEKLAFNDNRADHTYEARKAAGGKAF